VPTAARAVGDKEAEMHGSRSTSRIAIVLATVVALGALASAAQAATRQPAAMTRAEYQALMTRSEALNDRYGNAVTQLSPLEFTALWQAGGDRLEPQQLVALVTRSEALNEAYDRLTAFGPENARAALDPSEPAANGFGWADAGIGAATTLGLVLLTGGAFVATRHGRRVPSARVS
jgi:hypothetical protein